MEQKIEKLQQLLAAEDYEAALPISSEVAANTPGDVELALCHIVCLMQNAKFDDALAFITGNKLDKELWFEHAYALYRTNQSELCVAVLDANDARHLGAQQLRAQALFRGGKYLEAATIYETMVGNEEIDENELKANLCACYSAAGEASAVDFLRRFGSRLESELSDLEYNRACAMIEGGDLEGALEMLKKAEASVQAALEEDDDASDEDVANETAMFRVQRAYVLQCFGRDEEAKAIYEQIIKQKPKDAVVVAVASNNLICLKRDKDLFDSEKKAKLAITSDVEKKMTYRQRRAMAFNRCLLLLSLNRLDKCRLELDALATQYPDSELVCLVKASLLVREGKAKESTDMLEKYVKDHPAASHRVQLTLAQLLLQAKNFKGAIAILEQMNKIKLRLGVTATLVRLYLSSGEVDAAFAAIQHAAKNWSGAGADARRMALWRELARLNMENGRFAQAVEVLEKIASSDKSVVPLLVKAAAAIDPAKAERFAASLPPLPSPSQSVDALESLSARSSRVRATDASDAADTAIEKKKEKRPLSAEKKQKKKLKRVLKDIPHFDPTYVPDPDRWLPRHQRSKQRGKGSRKVNLKGSQGSAAASSSVEHTASTGVTSAPIIPSVSASSIPAAARKKGRR